MCDERFNARAAQVVCRDLGYTPNGAEVLTTGFTKGYPSQPIWLEYATCTGNESVLTNCRRDARSMCYHDRDVGVKCTPSKGI